MGTLFQLLLFGMLCCILAVVIGSGLAFAFWVVLKIRGARNIRAVVSKGFFYPYKLVPYIFAAVIVSIVVCEQIRGVDAPFSDYWTIPVDEEVYILAIDTMDDWRFSPVGGGEAISDNIRSVAADAKRVYGFTDSGFSYIYDKTDHTYTEYKNESDFFARLGRSGIEGEALSTPENYYRDARVFGDIILFILILVYPLYSFYRLLLTVKNAA